MSRPQTRAPYPYTDGYVERDGVRVSYEVYGAGEPSVLLLPTEPPARPRCSPNSSDAADHPMRMMGLSAAVARLGAMSTATYPARAPSVTPTAALFGRVMGLVALTVAFATGGVWLGRNSGGAGWFIAWLLSLGCLVGSTSPMRAAEPASH